MSNGWTPNNPYSIEEEIANCIANETHMVTVDRDGYCEVCGHINDTESCDIDYTNDEDDHG